jgi:hypothetical protein
MRAASAVGAELVVEELARDVQVGRAVAPLHRPQRVAERAAGVALREYVGAFAGVRSERGDVHERSDLAGVGVDVRDHGAAVGVADEHDRAVDAADQVGDRLGVGGEAAERVGGGDDVVAGILEMADDAVPARRLGKSAVDEDDRGRHEGRSFRWGAPAKTGQKSES